MEETFVEVPGYPGYYISDLGRVKSVRFGREMILKPFKIADYLGVNLRNKQAKKKIWTTYVHHLVSIAFLNHWPKRGTTVINHKDGDRHNNRADNLELMTFRENIKLGYNAIDRKTKSFGVNKIVRTNKNGSVTIRYKVVVGANGDKHYLGCFTTEEQAAEVYRTFVEALNEQIIPNKNPNT